MCTAHTTVHIILISAFSDSPPLHDYILTIKQTTIQLVNMEPIPMDDPINYLGIVR